MTLASFRGLSEEMLLVQGVICKLTLKGGYYMMKISFVEREALELYKMEDEDPPCKIR